MNIRTRMDGASLMTPNQEALKDMRNGDSSGSGQAEPGLPAANHAHQPPADGAVSPVRRGDLIHYSNEPLRAVCDETQEPSGRDGVWWTHEKPRGLWVSVLGRDDWASWCRAESFRRTRRQCASRIVLSPSAKVLRMASAHEMDAFTRQYGEVIRLQGSRYNRTGINWSKVAAEYDGIIIAPYIWSRRLHDLTGWYYGWDCASGCIWNSRAIARVQALRAARVRETPTPAVGTTHERLAARQHIPAGRVINARTKSRPPSPLTQRTKRMAESEQTPGLTWAEMFPERRGVVLLDGHEDPITGPRCFVQMGEGPLLGRYIIAHTDEVLPKGAEVLVSDRSGRTRAVLQKAEAPSHG